MSKNEIVKDKTTHISENENRKEEKAKRNESMEFNLDNVDIDDKEFEIPPLSSLPTLESILSAPDEDDLEISNQIDNHGDILETSSISSMESSIASKIKQNFPTSPSKNDSGIKEKHGEIFREVLLKGISNQINSASQKLDAGLPTSLAVSSLVAVGMSHGLVLVFDHKQNLKWCLGSTAVGSQYGAISALSFNIDSSRLLCGFARGQITMWNLSNGKLLRTVTDAHPPGMAILHIKFTDDRTMAISSDSGGSVFQLDFRRTLGVRTCESQCLFSGSKGEACVVEPFLSQTSFVDHPIKDVVLLAMASLSKVLLIAIKPHLKLHFVHLLPGDPSTLPLLSWQYVVIQVLSNRIIDPVLAFGREKSINFAQVICKSIEDIKVTLLQQLNLSYTLLSFTWINCRTLVTLDTMEKAHLLDVRTSEELQIFDLSPMQLVYSTSFYKSLATGGNVSKALAYAGEKACYQSVVTYNNQLLILGTKGVHLITLRSWSDRINLLLKKGKYKQALKLGASFYIGEGKGLVGLPWNEEKRKSVVNELMIKVISQYIDVFMGIISQNSTLISSSSTFSDSNFLPVITTTIKENKIFKSPKKKGEEEEEEEDEVSHAREVIQTCITHCILTNNTFFLFDFLYPKFSKSSLTQSIFLEHLENFILKDQLVHVTPSIMKDFLDYFEKKNLAKNLNASLLHLEISSLDIHQTMSLCWKHGLYDVIFYIYNKGMKDYVTPLQDLLHKLASLSSKEKQEASNEQQLLAEKQLQQLGYKILLYISCCLTGRDYLGGEISQDEVEVIREEVLLCITCFRPPTASDFPSSSTSSSSTPLISYPFLRTLIHFDPREFFNVLSIAFDEKKLLEKSKQRFVDILLLVMVENHGFSPSEIGILFIFLARQMSKVNSSIEVKRSLFDQVLESLCTSDENSRHEERQQIFIELLKAGVLERFHRNGENREELRLVSMAEAAGFYRVVEVLHMKHKRYHLVLSCYWKDFGRQEKVFGVIESLLSDQSILNQEKNLIKKEFVSNIEKLVAIDASKTIKMILMGGIEGIDGEETINKIVNKLSKNDEALIFFFKSLFEVVIETGNQFFSSTTSSFFEENKKSIEIKRSFRIEPHLYDNYIKIICKNSPNSSSLLSFLQLHVGNFRPESLISIIEPYQFPLVLSFLYEVAGDLDKSFQKQCQVLEEILKENEKKNEEIGKIEERVRFMIIFLQRNKIGLNQEKLKNYWFFFIDIMLSAQNNKKIKQKEKLKEEKEKIVDCLKPLTSQVITTSMSFLPPSLILQHIILSKFYSSGQYGDLKNLLLNMMKTCEFERTMVSLCHKVVHFDLLSSLSFSTKQKKKASFAFHNSSNVCSLCHENIFDDNLLDCSLSFSNDSFVYFSCGHIYHDNCFNSFFTSQSSHQEKNNNECFLCNSKIPFKLKIKKNNLRFQNEEGISNSSQLLDSSSSSFSSFPSLSLSPAQYLCHQKVRKIQNKQTNLSILTQFKDSNFSTSSSSFSSSPWKKFNQNQSSVSSNAHWPANLSLAPPPTPISNS